MKTAEKRKIQRTRGFTLIEILVVIILISILTLLALRMFDTQTTARAAKAKLEMRKIADACIDFNGNNGEFPDTMADLVKAGIYKKVPVSPYGEEYYLDGNYVCCNIASASGSKGADSNDVLRLIYNRLFIFDEFDDKNFTQDIWDVSAPTNLKFDPEDIHVQRFGAAYSENTVVLTSKDKFVGGIITVKAYLPRRTPSINGSTPVAVASSKIEIGWGTNVKLSWETKKGEPFAVINAGSSVVPTSERKLVPNNNEHVFIIKTSGTAGKSSTKMNIRYYIDDRRNPLPPITGQTVSVTEQPIVITLSRDSYIDSVEASFGD